MYTTSLKQISYYEVALRFNPSAVTFGLNISNLNQSQVQSVALLLTEVIMNTITNF